MEVVVFIKVFVVVLIVVVIVIENKWRDGDEVMYKIKLMY